MSEVFHGELASGDTSDTASKYADMEPNEVTFAHMWDLFFEPELKKRKAAGALPENFELWIGQVLFPSEGEGNNRVLLNEEVKGMGLMRAQRPVQKGEAVTFDDLTHLEAFDLPDDILDFGHFTIIRSGEGWGMHFNFFYGRAKAREMLNLANQFLVASRESARQRHAGPAVYNLYSAAELVSKAELVLHRSPAANAKTHGAVATYINAWGKLGNIDAAFVALFNKLGRQRPSAMYGDAKSRPPAPIEDDFELVNAVIQRGLARSAKTTERNRQAAQPSAT